MTGPPTTREQYMMDLDEAQLYAGHQRLHPIGHKNRDAALAEAITRITQVAPWTRQAPRFIVDVANDALSTGSLDQALIDVQDASTFMATIRQREQLRQASPETQAEVWRGLNRKAQQALKAQGYLPPAEEDMRVRQASFAPDGNMLAGAMDLLGKGVGGAIELVGGEHAREAAGWTWDRVVDVSNVPGALYRQSRIDDSMGLGGLNSFNPGNFLESWRAAWHGEKVYDPKIAKEVAETFDDEDAYQFVARIATGESVYEIAKDMARPGTPAYADAVTQLLDFSENSLVQDGIAALQQAHISPGRDLARTVGLDPVEDKALYTLVSGAGDAAFQWFMDPTLVLGKVNKARLATKLGLTTVGGDVVNRVLSFYDEALDTRAATRAITDVTSSGYWRALQSAELNPTERAAVVLADHVLQGQYARLLQAMPGTARLQPELEKLRKVLVEAGPDEARRYFAQQGVGDDLFQQLSTSAPDRARMISDLADYSREVPVVKPMDVVRFFSGEAGLTALLRGDLAHYRYGFSTLPRLTRAGTVRTAAKIGVEDAIDFVADAHVRLREPILASDVAAGNIDAVQRGATLLLSPMARSFQKVTTLLPSKGYIAFGSRESVELFDQLLDYGVRGESRRQLFDKFIKATNEADARNVVQSAYRTMFANAGLLDDPEMPSRFVDRWLKSANQRYALDDLDKLEDGTRAGVWPDADRASAVAIPQFRELIGEVRRQRFQRLQTGWGGEAFWTPALKVWEPVAAFPERFMRVWRPAVLIRPAFPLRAGGEEAIAQFARLGPMHTIKQWLLLPIAAKDPELVKLTAKELGVGDGLLGWLPTAARQSASSEAHKVASAVEARLARFAEKFVTPAEVRAYRDHIFVDTVGDAYGEIAGTRVGIQGAIVEDDPTVFATVNVQTSRGPKVTNFTKIGGEYDQFATADELGRHILADTAAHVGRDRVARARLQVRSLFVDEGQAQRIGGTLGINGDGFEAVARVRENIASLPQPVRAKLRAWVDGEGWTVNAEDAAQPALVARSRPGEWPRITPGRGKAKRTITNEELGAMVAADVAGGNLAKIVDDMKLLNGSDRRALLADPVRAVDGLEMEDHWPDLIARLQRGDTEAWHQLEDEVAVAHMDSDALRQHVRGMDRMKRERFGNLTNDELLQQWSVTQRKALDQITLDANGSVIHGIAGRLADESFDGTRHALEADFALPARVHGPALKAVEGRGRTEQWVNGFFDWSGVVIKNIARQPLWQAAYANAYEEAQVLRRFITSPEHDATAARLFGQSSTKASDVLMEVEHRMEEAFRSGASELRFINDLDDADLALVLKAHGLQVSGGNLGPMREWWGVEREARAHISQIAATRATTDAIPYMDDHRIRSQAADMGRHVSPFWFAQETFYKRWARTFRQSPEAIARLHLAHHALSAIGWLDTNEHGEEVFVYPGSAYANKALTKFFDLLPGDAKYSLPIAVPLTGQLTHAIPGFDDLAQLPAAGPLIAFPMGVLRMVSPAVGVPLEAGLLPERAQGRDLPSLILPSSVKRLWDVATAEEGDLAGASIAAMQLMEASGHGIDETATPGERQAYLDRLRNHARILRLTQAIVGLTGPASPSPDLNPEDIDQQFQSLLQAGIPIEEAVTRFMKDNPDATAWTVFATESSAKAPTSPTKAALDSLLANEEFFEKYRSVGAWLLPQTPPGSEEPFDRQAWRQMLADEIRVRKTDEEMWRDVKYAEAATEFFDNKTKIDADLAATDDPETRRRINQFWTDWRDKYLAVHPVFKEEYESNANHQRRLKVMTDITRALDDPLAPEAPHADELRTLVENYQKIQRDIADSNASADHATDRQINARRNLRQFFDNWAQGYVAGHPTVEAFYQRIIVPELGLPPATTQEA